MKVRVLLFALALTSFAVAEPLDIDSDFSDKGELSYQIAQVHNNGSVDDVAYIDDVGENDKNDIGGVHGRGDIFFFTLEEPLPEPARDQGQHRKKREYIRHQFCP